MVVVVVVVVVVAVLVERRGWEHLGFRNADDLLQLTNPDAA